MAVPTSSVAASESRRRTVQCRILIVEDEWLQAENLEAMLSRHGHSICGVARTCEEAVALATSTHANIVLMDVKLLGGFDGIEAARRIGQARPMCRVIFITAYNDPVTIGRIAAVRPDAILEKPTALSAIEEAIVAAAERIGCEPTG
jgi:DNA-binding NarL/FixJ family response regulator